MMTVSKGNTGFLAVLETPVTGASQELWVQLTVGSQLVNFLATYSVLNCKLASLSKTTIPILGVLGDHNTKVSLMREALSGSLPKGASLC